MDKEKSSIFLRWHKRSSLDVGFVNNRQSLVPWDNILIQLLSHLIIVLWHGNAFRSVLFFFDNLSFPTIYMLLFLSEYSDKGFSWCKLKSSRSFISQIILNKRICCSAVPSAEMEYVAEPAAEQHIPLFRIIWFIKLKIQIKNSREI